MIQAGSVVGGSAMSRVLGQALQEEGGGAAGESMIFFQSQIGTVGRVRFVEDEPPGVSCFLEACVAILILLTLYNCNLPGSYFYVFKR